MWIQLKEVSRFFDSQPALDGVSLGIRDGEMVAVLGANGAGKSTLLQLIAGWISVSSGRITLDERLLKPSRTFLRREVMMLDEPRRSDAPLMAVIGQAVADYDADQEGIETDVARWVPELDLVGCYKKRSRDVSKGQRYKASLISLFAVSPKIWLLDEPFSSGLDASGLELMERMMREHRDAGGIVLFSTQWPTHALRLADRVLVLDESHLVWDRPTGELVDDESLTQASPALSAVLRGLQTDE